MKKKHITVRFEVEDEHPVDVAGAMSFVSPIGRRGFDAYLREILEVPQDPDTEPGEGYYVTGLEVLNIEEE